MKRWMSRFGLALPQKQELQREEDKERAAREKKKARVAREKPWEKKAREEAKKKEKAKVARERVAREEAKKKKARVAREEAKKMKRRVAREKVAREEVGRKVGKERRRNEGWNEHGWWSWEAQGWDGWEGWSQHNASSIDEPWEKLVRYLLLSFHTWAGQPPLCFTFGLGKPPIVCHMWAG